MNVEVKGSIQVKIFICHFLKKVYSSFDLHGLTQNVKVET